jgi:ATP-dependent RNA/DNA helicase IGHMBP2
MPAGDHLQLPPTVLSDKAAATGLATTLFERLHTMYGESISQMLTVQYRMHEDIMTWASRALYAQRLSAHASVATHTIATLPAVSLDSGDDGFASPLVLVDTAGCGMEERQEAEGGSRFNEGESECVVAIVGGLRGAGIALASIGVITPYSAQRSR